MKGISIIMPCESERVTLLKKTLKAYSEYGIPNNVEFLILTRTMNEGKRIISDVNVNVIRYEWKGQFFNPSKALNLGIKKSKYDNILVTCPEVKPLSDVLNILLEKKRNNYVCQVFDQAENGSIVASLVNSTYRSDDPAMYFLAIFKKEDLYKINGWDESFMGGYAWEDSDFGKRFKRAKLKFKVLNEITAVHQYHKRGSISEGWIRNQLLFERNNRRKMIRCINGLEE